MSIHTEVMQKTVKEYADGDLTFAEYQTEVKELLRVEADNKKRRWNITYVSNSTASVPESRFFRLVDEDGMRMRIGLHVEDVEEGQKWIRYVLMRPAGVATLVDITDDGEFLILQEVK